MSTSKPASPASRAASTRSGRVTVPNSGPMKMPARFSASPSRYRPSAQIRPWPGHGVIEVKAMASSLCACCTPAVRRCSRILGDSLQVMASLAEREGLRGKVQCIYIDPPYGIKFNSNFQWSTTSRDVKDGSAGHITREPEQVKAFRDTWRDGIHSYLTYLRDRLVVARDLLSQSGSLFVQIGDENIHRVRALLDEVFDARNFLSLITIQ